MHWLIDWGKLGSEKCLQASDGFETRFKEIQNIESQYRDVEKKCRIHLPDIFQTWLCEDAGIYKIETCSAGQATDECKEAEDAFNFGLVKKRLIAAADKRFGMNELNLKTRYTQSECERAFRQYALKHHPDKNDGNVKPSFTKLSGMIENLCTANNQDKFINRISWKDED